MSSDWQDDLDRLREKERLARQILGMPDHADLVAIKKAFHMLAMQCHPDKSPGDREAAKRFLSIMNAYEFLAKGEAPGWNPDTSSAEARDSTVWRFGQNDWGYFCWWRQNFLAGEKNAEDGRKPPKRRKSRPRSKPGDWW
ncbi:MAG TPA: DnaJ domain-containing protein [Candidatus Brocadiia bacterium]|nr:DnaJ domain-containing protein [Candidatus Brocadiia bacterium]